MSSDELILEIFIITIFSIIQSIFGMGLLVFGTPTFLLLEYSFDETLSLLVPVSVTISALQLYSSTKKVDKKIIKYFFVWSLPLIVICLAVVTHFKLNFEINLILALMLILSAIINLSGKSKSNLSRLVKKHPRISFVFMGCVHGTSNMGGTILSVLSNAYYLKKEKILNFVAFCYFFFGVVQIITLVAVESFQIHYKVSIFCFIAFCTYLVAKKTIYIKTTDKIYRKLFGALMITYGLLLLIR
jgi:uncharacterized membrane protein YfcA